MMIESRKLPDVFGDSQMSKTCSELSFNSSTISKGKEHVHDFTHYFDE